jgi:hypothetical protein
MSQQTVPHRPARGWTRKHRRLVAVLFAVVAVALVTLWILAG